MTARTLGLIMNDVSGRMDVNQHLIRSVVAINKQGLLRDPERAAQRMKAVLAVRGLA